VRALLLAAAYSVISHGVPHGVPHGDRAEIDAAAAGAMFRPGPASRDGVRAVGGGGRRNGILYASRIIVSDLFSY